MCEFDDHQNNDTPMISMQAWSDLEKSDWVEKLNQSNFSKPDQNERTHLLHSSQQVAAQKNIKIYVGQILYGESNVFSKESST